MRKDGLFTVTVLVFAALVMVLFAVTGIYALSKQTAAYPGEVLDAQDEYTTAMQFAGVFAVEVSSTGVGTLTIERSEDNSSWHTVKTLTNSSAGEQRKYLYETFGDTDRSAGAYYRAYLTTLTSGSYRVRFIK